MCRLLTSLIVEKESVLVASKIRWVSKRLKGGMVGVGRLIYISGPISVMSEGALFTEGQSEKDGGNKTRMLLHMSLGVISTKQLVVGG